MCVGPFEWGKDLTMFGYEVNENWLLNRNAQLNVIVEFEGVKLID